MSEVSHPEPVEQNLTDVCEHIKKSSASKPNADLIERTLRNLSQTTHSQVEDSTKACEFHKWAKDHAKLKVVPAVVPYGVLPPGVEITLHDIRVFARHGPDDKIYDGNQNIRKRVARGNCLVEVHKAGESGDTGMMCGIYALKKFTGGLGDDDDRDKGDNHTWKRYFIKPLEDTVRVVCTRKANGEAAHLGAVTIDGVTYMCGGSKNVHMLFRCREDVERYTDDRYRIAREVCMTVMDLVDSLSQEQKNRLLTFLSASKLTGVFEILHPGHQHVEDLSYLPKPELRFIAWTSNNLEPPAEEQLCYMAPDVAIEISRALGLPTVEYAVISVDENENRMKEIRQGYNYEGEVLYFLDKTHSVIGVLKKKTIWYILCRALREKMKVAVRGLKKSPDDFSISKHEKKIEKRLKDIQSWLGLDDASLKAWMDLGTGFLKWCVGKANNGSMTTEQVDEQFPVTWKKFLKETGQSDRIEVKWEEPTGSDE